MSRLKDDDVHDESQTMTTPCDWSPQGWVSDNLTDYDGDGCGYGPENDGMGETKMMTTTGFSIL